MSEVLRPESALAVLVPEAEVLVGSFRLRHDPGAGIGMPAHITVLYPFRSPGAIDEAVLQGLHALFRGFPAFDFGLTAIRRFPDQAVYLAVEPEEPFRRLTLAVWKAFPDAPPYGGRYAAIVPHLTIARWRQQLPGEEAHLARVAEAFAEAASGALPIHCRAGAITLLDARQGQRWQTRTSFPLGER